MGTSFTKSFDISKHKYCVVLCNLFSLGWSFQLASIEHGMFGDRILIEDSIGYSLFNPISKIINSTNVELTPDNAKFIWEAAKTKFQNETIQR